MPNPRKPGTARLKTLLVIVIATALTTPAMAADLLFKNVTVIDGSGGPGYAADVLVGGDRIVKIGEIEAAPAGARAIDGEGLVLAPGFIDMHSHLDFQLPFQPLAENVVAQGVTTVVAGQCGFSLAPQPEGSSMLSGYLAALGLEDQDLVYRSLADYLSDLEEKGISVNVAMLAPHGVIRETAMGHRQGAPGPDELEKMKRTLEGAMEDGAFGMSTGLAYPPGYNSDTEELIELMKAAAPFGGTYFTHMRDEGAGVLDSVAEAIRIGEESGTAVQIVHVKAVGSPNYGKVADVLALMEDARDRGVDVTGDVYPYNASSTSLSAIMLPPSAFESGDVAEMMESLKDPDVRKDIKEFAEKRMLSMAPKEGALKILPDVLYLKLIKYVLARTNVVVGVNGHPEYNGKTFAEVRKMRKFRGDLLDMGMDIIAETGRDCTIISFMMSERDVNAALASPIIMIGSDGMGYVESGQHPRSFGTFPRVLGKVVREDKLIDIEDAVRKMTGMAADKLGLEDRGYVRQGYRADLVLFDPETIIDKADFINNHEPPEGVLMTVVNGEVTVEDGVHTGARAGKALRKNKLAPRK